MFILCFLAVDYWFKVLNDLDLYWFGIWLVIFIIHKANNPQFVRVRKMRSSIICMNFVFVGKVGALIIRRNIPIPDYSWIRGDFMNNPSFGLRLRPLALRAGLEQGAKHPFETCNEAFSLFAGAYSRIRRIRELCRLGERWERERSDEPKLSNTLIHIIMRCSGKHPCRIGKWRIEDAAFTQTPYFINGPV